MGRIYAVFEKRTNPIDCRVKICHNKKILVYISLNKKRFFICIRYLIRKYMTDIATNASRLTVPASLNHF